MPQIDFYITKEAAPQFALRTACRVTEKAHQAGYKVHLLTNNDSDTQALDALLWTFRDRSFIPHEIFSSVKTACPVTISAENSPVEAEILINISYKIPKNLEHFQRIAEIIDNHPESIGAGRERYRFYREQGHKPLHHEVSTT